MPPFYTYISAGVTPFTGLLDEYPNAAAAYSLRKLSSTYNGSAIKVRRDSDNTELDIGFINNKLDTASLLSFVGSNNGFISIWYDQSGNNYNAFQPTEIYQPKIINLGNLILENNKISIEFIGVNNALYIWNNQPAPLSFQNIGSNLTILSVEKCNNISGAGLSFWFNYSTIAEIRNNNSTTAHVPFNIGYSNAKSGFGVSNNYITGAEGEEGSILTVSQRLTTRYINNDNLSVYVNNSIDISTTLTIATGDRTISTSNSTFSIGMRSRDNGLIDGSGYNGVMQELIIWGNNLIANENNISTDVNNYYSIYP